MPRIAYWTSSFEPDMEAVASEVAMLRRHNSSSISWGLSHRHWALLSWRRGFCLHPRLQLLFRLATRLLEPVFQLNHIFGSLGDWFYLRGLRRRPTILTVATWNPPVDPLLLRAVDRFAVESPAAIDTLLRLGIDSQRIRLILPGVDLERFSPTPPPTGPFTVLFASSPDKESWLAARGLPQLLDAAALCPDMRFRLLWRPWGDSEPRVRQWLAERSLPNVELAVGCWTNMAPQYQAAHVTVAPFTDSARSKPAPNSLIESLACGRPVVVTEAVGLAELIRTGRAGRICAATGEAIAEELRCLQADWGQYTARARSLAEQQFGIERFLDDYGRLYEGLLGKGM